MERLMGRNSRLRPCPRVAGTLGSLFADGEVWSHREVLSLRVMKHERIGRLLRMQLQLV